MNKSHILYDKFLRSLPKDKSPADKSGMNAIDLNYLAGKGLIDINLKFEALTRLTDLGIVFIAEGGFRALFWKKVWRIVAFSIPVIISIVATTISLATLVDARHAQDANKEKFNKLNQRIDILNKQLKKK